MSRIRSIHPGILTDESFMALTVECPLAVAMLIGIWMDADDSGVFEWKPFSLKAKILPAVMVDTTTLLAALIQHKFIKSFEVNSKQYGVVRNFVRFQRPKSPKYVHPMTDEMRMYAGYEGGKIPKAETGRPPSDDSSERVPNLFVTTSGISPQRKEEGGMMEEEDGDKSLSAREIGDLAEEFYLSYPKKVDPRDARAKFEREVRKGANPWEIVGSAKRYAEAHRLAGTDKQFIPAPAVWLNKGSYLSEDLPKPRTAGHSSSAARPQRPQHEYSPD